MFCPVFSQPAANAASKTRLVRRHVDLWKSGAMASAINARNAHRGELAQKTLGSIGVECGTRRAHAEEETAARREIKIRRVENRMAQSRQSVEREKAEERSQRRTEHRKLEGRWDESGPRVQRPSSRVDRIIDHRAVPLHEVAAEAAEHPADECQQRHAVTRKSQRLGKSIDRKGRISFEMTK